MSQAVIRLYQEKMKEHYEESKESANKAKEILRSNAPYTTVMVWIEMAKLEAMQGSLASEIVFELIEEEKERMQNA